MIRLQLDSNDKDNFVYLDVSQIKAIQVIYPTESNLVLQGDKAIGAVRVFVKNMSNPFQFLRNTRKEIAELLTKLTPEVSEDEVVN